MNRRWLAVAASATVVLAVFVAGAAAAAAPTITAKVDASGQVAVSWALAPGQTSMNVFWSTESTTAQGPSDNAPVLACAATGGIADHCTGYRNLGGTQTSSTVAGLAPGTYYVQLVVNDPPPGSSFGPVWSNVLKIVVPAKASGGTTAPAKPPAAKLGKIPRDNGTKACRAVIARIKYANGEIQKVLNNLKFVDKTGNGSVQATRKAQLQKRLKALEKQLVAAEAGAATACK